MSVLSLQRAELNKILDLKDPAKVENNWFSVKPLISNWWEAYKKWESTDTFDKAFEANRMTVRTFDEDFTNQVSKGFNTIDIPGDRYFADNQYTPLDAVEQERHRTAFRRPGEFNKYTANRGIDSSAFANPANFANRRTKYELGLHDLSASLLNHNYPITSQVHHKWVEGAHFSFLPVSKEDDQEVLYNLIQYAKQLKAKLPALDTMVRGYRAEMTRVKLAHDADMAIGYSAVPAPNPGQGPAYNLRYGLGATTTSNSITMAVTPQLHLARQEAARKFKGILAANLGKKNEIIIAMRKHAGAFPVFAVRHGRVLECYDIAGGQQIPNGKIISNAGKLT